MNKNLLTFLIVAFILGGVFIIFKQNNPLPPAIYIDSSTTTISNAAASDAEVYVEADKTVLAKTIERIDKVKANKRVQDSIRTANRKKFWAYQIGVNRSSPHDFEPMYKALYGKVVNIYLFKEARHSYYLIKNDGYTTQEELIANHDEVEMALQQAGVSEGAIITNLTNFCDLKDDVKLDGDKKVGPKEKIACLVCD